MVSSDIDNQHSIETYKSLIAIGQFSLRFVLMINGGAIVALIAFVGDLGSSTGRLPDVGAALTFFVLGIAVGGAAVVTTYLTQLVLYNEPRPEISPPFLRSHKPWLWATIGFVILSVVFFAIGSFDAIASYDALMAPDPA